MYRDNAWPEYLQFTRLPAELWPASSFTLPLLFLSQDSARALHPIVNVKLSVCNTYADMIIILIVNPKSDLSTLRFVIFKLSTGLGCRVIRLHDFQINLIHIQSLREMLH